MTRCSAHSPYTTLFRSITSPTEAPSFTMSLISVARRFITSKSNPTRLSPARASPESLRRTRWYLSLVKSRRLLFAHLESNEAANLDVLAELGRSFLDEIADRFLRLSHPRLVDESDVLVVRLDLA